MNAASVPCPETTRSSWPSATVASHTPTPVGTRAAGRRQARVAASPAARPARNGHAVLVDPGQAFPGLVAGPADHDEGEHAEHVSEHTEGSTHRLRLAAGPGVALPECLIAAR